MKIGEKWVDALELPETAAELLPEFPDKLKVCLMFACDSENPFVLRTLGDVVECYGYYLAKTFGIIDTKEERIYLLGPHYWKMAGKTGRIWDVGKHQY